MIPKTKVRYFKMAKYDIHFFSQKFCENVWNELSAQHISMYEVNYN